jgi:hypothetical protein
VILLLVLAARSLLPTGFMLQASDASAGSFEIVICTSSGTKMMTVDENGTPVPTSKSQHLEKGLCPFAAAGVLALATTEPLSLAGQVQYAAVTYSLAVSLFAETPKPGATSARGPPPLLV